MANLFDTPTKIEKAAADFTNLLENPGWKLVEQILDANIEVCKMQLEEGTGEAETKDSIERLREKLRIYKEIRNTPQTMLDKFSSGEDIPVDFDPYYNVGDKAVEQEVDKQEEKS